MKDDTKTKKQLVHELAELRSQDAALKKSTTGSISAELAAEEARRYAESIVGTIREPLLVLDANLKIISANRNFYKIFKVTPYETLGIFIYDLGNKQWDIPKLRELLEEVLPEKEAFDDFEVDHNFENIGHKVMLLNARQIYRKDIGAKMILLAIEDITEQKRLENLLTESEERYRRLFETASDGIVLLEKREGKITQANPATEKMLGYTKKDSIGNSLQDIGVLLDMGDFQTTMQNLNKIGILNYDDVPVKTKSGQHIDTDIYLVDRARLVQCNIRDITDRKQAEEKLRESEELLRSYLEYAPDGICVSDLEGNLLYGNLMCEEIIGYRREELIGKKFLELNILPEKSLNKAVQMLQGSKEGKSTGPIGIDLISKEGRLIPVEINTNVIQRRGQGIVLSFIRDITDRKQAEEKLQQTLESLRKAVGATVKVMVSAVEARDPYTSGHQLRSANLACAIATEMGLPQDKIEGLLMAGSIHDIGKLSVPAEILSKPTKLTELEFSLIKEHSLRGYEMVKDVESPWPLAQIVYQHHERMDGSGYPRNLKGDKILMEARIMAVSDVVEAMASHRPYRPSLGINAALEEIEKNRGTFYDEAVADVCLRLFREKGYQFRDTFI